MTKYKVGAIIFAFTFCAMLIAFIVNIVASGFDLVMIPAILITLGLGTGAIYNFIQFNRTKSSEAVVAATADRERSRNSRQLAQVAGKSVDGLPVPAGVSVTAKLFGDKIDFITLSGGFQPNSHYNLDIDKIQKVTICWIPIKSSKL